jgi:hypothetical protein
MNALSTVHNYRVHPTPGAAPGELGCSGERCAPGAGDAERWADENRVMK